MSNQTNSARDYIESYIEETNKSDDYSINEQPIYDPTKSVPSPPTSTDNHPVQEEKKIEPSLNIHLPTINPISSEKKEQKDNTPVPEVTYTSRDFKEQRNVIHETALTVCADLHENLLNCFQNGSWWDKAKMCEEQKQLFWKCYNTQKTFLKEVDYKGPMNTDQEDNNILLAAFHLRTKQDKAKTESA
ncbi:hypothetical protein BDB01DRAFT_834368 [Pilobolus umbonatus]|nr:hypothetical protein BDB01DRAFT_834368 [Pilobolus umbonatus]